MDLAIRDLHRTARVLRPTADYSPLCARHGRKDPDCQDDTVCAPSKKHLDRNSYLYRKCPWDRTQQKLADSNSANVQNMEPARPKLLSRSESLEFLQFPERKELWELIFRQLVGL
jgi:hypothetical protein